jgi:ribosomal-protein-alanine N-acetyltransferase
MVVERCRGVNEELMALDRRLGGGVWDEYHWESVLKSPLYTVYVVREEGRIVGFVVFYTGIAEVHLLKLYVLEDMRGRGIGGMLLGMVEQEAARRGGLPVYLETPEDNLPAIGFYTRRGYKVIGKRNGYYTDGRAALLLFKEVTGVRTIRLALGVDEGGKVVDDHLGEAPMFRVYDLTENGWELVDTRQNDAPEEKTHGDPNKRRRVLEILSDCEVLVAPKVSTSFIKMKDMAGPQPVVIMGVPLEPDTFLGVLKEHFGTIWRLVGERRLGKPTGKILLIQNGEEKFV